jgi:hypothetical protein
MGGPAMKQVTISFVAADDEDEDYYRAVWYLTGALVLLGARGRVVPTLRRLFDDALKECGSGECWGGAGRGT